MEPKLPASNRRPEQMPTTFSKGLEHIPSFSPSEKILEQRNERAEAKTENVVQAVPNQPILPPPVQGGATTTTSAPVNDDDTPLIAADDDLIEKEWVDKAKEIIARTKDDPYLREREVSRLQADYLQKRYGKELGAA